MVRKQIVIIIDEPTECPFRSKEMDYRGFSSGECMKSHKPCMERIGNSFAYQIPRWCPLDDYYDE